ncbi:DUF3046 domain-containing protein [Ruicaihuangia caeni]|uniref:DUF3046 domain-containing protein n=1 Tax=Ruicaihuangia caeni TaxID=3042517 RepID=UPI00339004C2
MRRSEFWVAVDDEFGPHGRVLTRDLTLLALGGVTAEQALDRGFAPREVWLALARENDVPPGRWHGVGQREPKRAR